MNGNQKPETRNLKVRRKIFLASDFWLLASNLMAMP